MKTLTYRPHAGEHLIQAARWATALARSYRALVRFQFNDCTLVATPKKSPCTIAWEFDLACDRAHSKWKNSAEGQRQLAARAEQIKARQQLADCLTSQLPDRIAGGLDALMEWVREVQPVADDIAVDYDAGQILQLLLEAGYKADRFVGQPRDSFNTRARLGGYIIGQVISALQKGMPPHPICLQFIDRYFALPRLETKEAK
jgi:hypothetical protein